MSSLHQRNAHGRAFFGEEALHFLASRKRDSHGDHILLKVPAGFSPPVEKAVVIQTLVSQVFITVPQSFTGSAAGLHTLPAGVPANTGAMTTQRDGGSESTPTGRPSANRGPSQQLQPTNHRHETTTTGWNQATQSASFSGTVTAAYDPDATYYTNNPGNTGGNSSAIYGQSTSDKAAAGVSQDLPLAVKAGIAVGAVVGFALLGILLFYCLRRRKSSSGGDNNEKHGSIFGAQQDVPQPYPVAQPTPRTASAAPRLSLRPVTQFLPNLAENRKSGDLLNGMTGGAKSAWQRQPASENPFADGNIREKSRPMTPNGNPFDDRQGLISSAAVPANASPPKNSNNQFPQASRGPVVAAPPAAVVANTPASHNDSGRESPASQRGPNNVHRVQLDFKPSMDDELELRSGQLVRMLHEYDDGWALCVRMDRSQQGVCPRTCLSKLPVKPRQGPPGNARPYSPNAGPNPNGQRTNSPSPTGQPSRPQIPAAASMRPDSSQMFNPNGMFPRPLTPTGNTDRAESPDHLRKLVPGQAF